MAGWRRLRFKGGRPGNFRKSNTESFEGEEGEDEEEEMDWNPEKRFINGKGKESLNHKNVDNAIRASLCHVVTKPTYLGQKENLAQKAKNATKNKRIAHLNGLVKLWSIKRSFENGDKNTPTGGNISRDTKLNTIISIEDLAENVEYDLHFRELLLCLRVPLIHESSEVRASTLRTIRLLVSEAEHVDLLYETNMHYLIVRSLDIDLDNKIERIQALKLIRRCIQLGSRNLPLALARAIVALVEGGTSEGDRLYRAALCICCELSVLHSDLFIQATGVPALTHALLDCSVSRMAEAILGCLAALHNDPETRSRAKIELGIVVAPFTEFRYVHSGQAPGAVVGPGPGTGPGGGHRIGLDPAEERAFHFQCAEMTIISMLRSWSGLLLLTEPGATNGVSHLQALVDILYLDNSYVREKLLLLFYEVLNLKAPNDLSCFSAALEAADPTAFRESWKLAEDFVAREGMDILPQLATSRPNLLESHTGFVLSSFLKTELPDALVKVIVTADSDELSILAAILLGELLHMANVLLPRELNATSHCLPALLAEVSATNAVRSNRASEAVDALHRLHDIKKRGPVGNSLFLDQIMSGSTRSVGKECFIGDRLHSPANWSELLKHEPAANERINASIRESQVNNVTVDPDISWDWDLITSVFKWPSDAFRSLDTAENRNFVKRVVDFFKPSGNQFSKVELRLTSGKFNKKSRFLAKTGCYLLDFLVSVQSVQLSKTLDDFLLDIQNNFNALIDASSQHDCFLSPTRVATTASHYYFLFIGRLSRSETGRNALDRYHILQSLTLMLSLRSDLYLKLVISCLDYSTMEWGSRNLLAKALTKEGSESCRLYATRFLGVLIRSRTSNVAQWGVDLLVGQLFDTSKAIAWVALEILEDACDDKMNLEAVVCAIKTLPLSLSDLNHLGLKGVLLCTRFLSSSSGLKFLSQKDEGLFLKKELELWAIERNLKYVSLIEELINDGLSRHQLNETRTYGRRSREGYSVKDIFVPPHLYGQLAHTKDGLELLLKEQPLADMIKLLTNLCCSASHGVGKINTDIFGTVVNVMKSEWTRVKSAIWGVAHVASSSIGATWVDKQCGIGAIIKIVEDCDVYSLRGTAFYALGLIATNKVGCQILSSYGWCCLRYARNEQLPILEDWFHPTNKAIDESLSAEFGADEGSDLVCSSLGTSLTDPERTSRLSTSETFHFEHSTENIQQHRTPKRNDEMRYSASDERSQYESVERGSIYDSTKKSRLQERSNKVSHRKRLSSIFRSLSLGKENDLRRDKDKRGVGGKNGEKSKSATVQDTSFSRTSEDTAKRHKDSENKGKESKHSLLDNGGSDNDLKEIAMDLSYRIAGRNSTKMGEKDSPCSAPIATPENSNGGSSDKGVLGTLEDIGEENGQYMLNERLKGQSGSSFTHNLDKISKITSTADHSNKIESKSSAPLERSSKVLSDQKQESVSVDEISVETALISYNQTLPKFSSPSTKIFSSGCQKLSPIASSTSISAMGIPGEGNFLNVACVEAKVEESLKQQSLIENSERLPSKIVLHPEVSGIHHLKEASTQQSLPSVPFKRTGQRAFSESEAQNFSHASHVGIMDNIPNAAYLAGNRSTRSESCYSAARVNLGTMGIPKISLISGSHQRGTFSSTYGSAQAPLSRLGTSVTSVSSSGSWTETPGFYTLRSLRKRPQLVDNETLPTIDGMSHTLSGAQQYTPNQRTGTGLFGIAGEGVSGSSSSAGIGSGGVPKRSNSISKKFRSLDYRFNRLKHRLQVGGQGTDSWSIGGITTLECTDTPQGTKNSQIIRPLESTQIGLDQSYWGITFPTRLERLFTNPYNNLAELSSQEKHQRTLLDEDVDLNMAINDLTITSISAAYKIPNLLVNQGLALHTQEKCLSCYRLFSNSVLNSPKKGHVPKGLSNVIELFSSQKEKPNHEVEETALAGSKKDNAVLEVLKRREVLKLVGCMNATVGAKTAEQGLLRLKQNYAQVFTDLCLYSEVCLLLTEYSFRLFSRRFLQELFMDLDFKELYIEPYKILGIIDEQHGNEGEYTPPIESVIENIENIEGDVVNKLTDMSSKDALSLPS